MIMVLLQTIPLTNVINACNQLICNKNLNDNGYP